MCSLPVEFHKTPVDIVGRWILGPWGKIRKLLFTDKKRN